MMIYTQFVHIMPTNSVKPDISNQNQNVFLNGMIYWTFYWTYIAKMIWSKSFYSPRFIQRLKLSKNMPVCAVSDIYLPKTQD